MIASGVLIMVTNIVRYIRFSLSLKDVLTGGKGYYGLTAEQIPLPAKIISICDTYSAITMRRSYKEPMTHETAMKIINDVAGSQLDAQLVKIFNTIPKEKLLACAPETIFA